MNTIPKAAREELKKKSQGERAWDFYRLFNKSRRMLHACPTCGLKANVNYIAGYGVRIDCANGCNTLTMKRKDYMGQAPTEESFAELAVDKWNTGDMDV